MWTTYREIARKYDRLPLNQERRLIAKAQHGSAESAEELVMRHIGFVMFRLRQVVYPNVLRRLGDDLLADSVILLYEKVKTYNLRYRDKQGKRKPVRFVSYIWKRVDGFIIDALNREHRYVAVENIDKVSVGPHRTGRRGHGTASGLRG